MATPAESSKNNHENQISSTPPFTQNTPLQSSSAAFGLDTSVSLHSLRAGRQRWETLFEPHYSFGSAHPGDGRDGMPSLDQERGSADVDSVHAPFSPIATPTLPRLDDLKLHHHETRLSDHQIEILPCPSQSLDAFQRCPAGEQQRWLDRLDLLDMIRRHGFGEQNDTSDMDRRRARQGTMATHWQRQIRLKAEQIKRDCKVEDEREMGHVKDVEGQKGWDEGEEADKDKKEEQQEQREHQQRLRRSFLYFALGFIFPPIWIVGALYTPAPANTTLSSANRRTDLLWKRRSRNAFCIFLALMALVLVLTLVFKPSSVGWRQSKGEYSPAPST